MSEEFWARFDAICKMAKGMRAFAALPEYETIPVDVVWSRGTGETRMDKPKHGEVWINRNKRIVALTRKMFALKVSAPPENEYERVLAANFDICAWGNHEHWLDDGRAINGGGVDCGADLVQLLYSPDHSAAARAEAPRDDKYPHKCPRCGSPAYVGFSSIECSRGC